MKLSFKGVYCNVMNLRVLPNTHFKNCEIYKELQSFIPEKSKRQTPDKFPSVTSKDSQGPMWCAMQALQNNDHAESNHSEKLLHFLSNPAPLFSMDR